MQQIINFIIRNKTFLLFLFLFAVAMGLTIQSHKYHKSKFINSANALSGGVYSTMNNISEYFSLRKQNDVLSEENSRLKSLLYNSEEQTDSIILNNDIIDPRYVLTSAKVLKNGYSSPNNVLLINKGKNDSIKQDFGVITSKGILGIVDNTSNKFSTVISILNTDSRISTQLLKTNHFGTLTWNGKSPTYVQLIDIPKIAPVEVGDTIITSGRSAIFPKGIQVGVIDSFELDEAENFYLIQVRLFNDMTNVEHVYVIENKDAIEINTLLNTTNE